MLGREKVTGTNITVATSTMVLLPDVLQPRPSTKAGRMHQVKVVPMSLPGILEDARLSK